jgi:hypothetical protein
MKNFKVMMVATLLLGSFALNAVSLCPFTLVNRTDGVIHANIGTQVATEAEGAGLYGYKTLQPGESKCFYLGRRFNKENKLYIRYQGIMPNKSPYPAHEFIINIDDKSLESIDREGYVAARYSLKDLFTEIDSRVVVIGERAMLADPGSAKIVFFGKAETEKNKTKDAALILSPEKNFDIKTGEEVRDFKREYKLP